MKHGKKYAEALKAFDRQNLYDMNEACSVVKKTALLLLYSLNLQN